MTIAHEYAHHLQYLRLPELTRRAATISVKGLTENDISAVVPRIMAYKVLVEGHALGIERHVCKVFAQHGNHAYNYRTLERQTALLRAVHIFQCHKTKQERNYTYWEHRNSFDYGELDFLYRHQRPSPYALGSALFLLNEHKGSDNIYQSFLNGGTTWIKLLQSL